MKPLAIVLAAMAASGLWAQTPADAPVSKAEANQALSKLKSSLERGLKIQLPAIQIKASDGIASRAEIILELDRIYNAAMPGFKFTPRPYRVVPGPVTKANSAEIATKALRLVRYGAMAPVGPLVVGPSMGVTPDEFGDALGMTATAISACYHEPDPEFSPALMP